MYRRLVFAAALGLTASCTVAPTPREYIDRQIPIDDVRHQAESEVEALLNALVQALRQGDLQRAEFALAPAPDIAIVGPGEGQNFVGAAQVRTILELFTATAGSTIEVADLEVRATPRGASVWFVARLSLRRPGAAEPVPLRVTGVYVTREANWELQQAHFSAPVDMLTLLSPPAPAPPASPAEAG